MPSLDDNQVQAWMIEARDLVPIAEARIMLDDAERTRASRFRTPLDREMFARGHATFRAILAASLSLPAANLRFEKGAYGKPYLPFAPYLHFNWSHAGDYWLLALSRTGPIGVDIERVQVDWDWRAAARVAFHPRDQRYVERSLEGSERSFFDIWTRKEAAFKGTGTGLHDRMTEISVVDESAKLKSSVRMLDGMCWHLHPLPAPHGYAATVAASFQDAAVRCQNVPPHPEDQGRIRAKA